VFATGSKHIQSDTPNGVAIGSKNSAHVTFADHAPELLKDTNSPPARPIPKRGILCRRTAHGFNDRRGLF